MALTPSKMIPLGTTAPGFSLEDVVSGKEISLESYRGKKATVLMFICNHCPYVHHVQKGLVEMTNAYKNQKDVAFIAINSNDVKTHPDDSPELMKKAAATYSYSFPYCFDETQKVAKSFEAACTPDFYVLDKNLCVAYRGQMDDSRPGNNIPVTGKDLRAAIDALIKEQSVPSHQKPSVGCNIKWKT